MQKITPFLWFDGNAEEAMNFYTTTFKGGKILSEQRHGGQLFGGAFEIEGMKFNVLNGGPQFKFTEAISMFVNCETQAEVDELWDKLTADDGQPGRCGWLKDKFGLSWQIIPTALGRLMNDSDTTKAQRVIQAMMQMGKIEIAKLEEAYNQG